MPRLRHARTGVVLNVDDDTASRLDANWGDANTVSVTATASASPALAPSGPPAEPRGNGSREEWAAYADSLGVTYGVEAKRGDIKDAIAAAADASNGDDSSPGAPTDARSDPAGDDE